MIPARIASSLAVCGLLVFAASGCASFRGGELAETTPWPPVASPTKKSVSLVLAGGTVSVNGNPTDASPMMLQQWREKVEKTYADSSLFSAVLPESAPADVRAEVHVSDIGEGSMGLAFLCGFTMFIIPATAIDHFTMKTDFKNANGDVLATIEKSDSSRLWMQLFLVFVMPFNWPPSVGEELFRDLSRATLADAHGKNIL